MSSFLKALLWVGDVFAAEFGNSDVQSNYSRLYAWMANQLGHMTLGLATALAFVWIYETLHDLALRPTGADGGVVGAVFVNFGGLAMLLGVGCLTIYQRVNAKPLGVGLAHRNRIYPLSPRIGLWVGVVVGVSMMALYFRILMLPEAEQSNDLIRTYALSGAALTILGAITILSKDWRAMVLGYLYVGGAWWLATANLDPLVGMKQPIALGLILALAVVLLGTARNYDETDQKVPGPKAWLIAVALTMATVGVLWWLDGQTSRLDQQALEQAGITEAEWRLAFAAAIAALSLWFVKEFGSDIPLVSVEVARAASARAKHGHPDYPAIERAYFIDAVWDARTDGVFYVSGAIIAIALLTQTGMFESTWASGPDFLGILAFGLIFLIAGRRWAYRQQALDLVGSPYASRLAVMRNALELRVIHDGNLGPLQDDPLAVLLEFASGGTPRAGKIEGESATLNFDHLVILGRLGSGKTPLGIALSSEAALHDLKAKIGNPFTDSIRARKSSDTKTWIEPSHYEEAGRRDAAYTRLKNLYTLAEFLRSKGEREIGKDAARQLCKQRLAWLKDQELKANFVGICPIGTEAKDAAALPGPVDLLVVDDINLALPGNSIEQNGDADRRKDQSETEAESKKAMSTGQDVQMLKEILPVLPKDRDQHTVWVIDVPDFASFSDFIWSGEQDVRKSNHPIPEPLRPLLGELSVGLRRRSGDTEARIAVAFVKMDDFKEVKPATTQSGSTDTGQREDF